MAYASLTNNHRAPDHELAPEALLEEEDATEDRVKGRAGDEATTTVLSPEVT
jgi:hypothetical protein